MDLSRVILGSVVTEKAERLKASGRTYTLRIAPAATKIEVAKALKHFYDIDVTSVRVLRARGKTRIIGQGKVMEKRHPMKKVMVTVSKKSKPLDLAAFAST